MHFKIKKLTALLAGICLLTTGCGAVGQDSPDEIGIPITTSVQESTVPVTSAATTAVTTVSTAFSKSRKTTAATTTVTTAVTSAATSRKSQSVQGRTDTQTVSAGYTPSDNGYTPSYSEESSPSYTPGDSPAAPDEDTRPAAATTAVTTAMKITTTTTTTAVPHYSPEELIEKMSLHEKVCQMFITSPEGLWGASTSAGSSAESAVKNYPIGGVILFAWNMENRSQTTGMLDELQTYSFNACHAGMFTAVDEEGGFVARAAQKLGTTAFSNMAVYGESNDYNTAYNIGSTIGSDLSGIGFNLDFAPVADVNISPENELGSRIFSSDPEVVANMVSGVVSGLQDNGVCATLKHFPGLGAETGNTHNDSFVVIDRTMDQLRAEEFIPFSAGIDAGADFVMVGHQITTAFGDDLPGDLSYTAVTEVLREELGFEGIAVTDAQQMNTIVNVYGAGDAAVRSVKAGIDIILMPNDLGEAVSAIENAVNSGDISEERIDESLSRILSVKDSLGLL
ncbi:MAG: glycoside hydrolase family 3 [Ruminococcus sp.]|nr:glycoside hydrolase family 3 [Ruminococcus sp.]